MEEEHASILDILDKLLEKGAVVKGDIVLSVADVDLVYLNLELLLSSIATLKKGAQGQKGKILDSAGEVLPGQSKKEEEELNFAVDQLAEGHSGPSLAEKPTSINMDEKNVERGLAKLVLAVVNLLRKLMERQAVRKMELGQLTDEETEKIGKTFFLLDKRINKLREDFKLEEDDLNLNLGPLGDLV